MGRRRKYEPCKVFTELELHVFRAPNYPPVLMYGSRAALETIAESIEEMVERFGRGNRRFITAPPPSDDLARYGGRTGPETSFRWFECLHVRLGDEGRAFDIDGDIVRVSLRPGGAADFVRTLRQFDHTHGSLLYRVHEDAPSHAELRLAADWFGAE